MEDEDNPFALLPRPVRLAFSEESWAAISAGEYDWKNPPTDAEANAYFDLVLTSFERANPIFLKHLIAVNAGFTPLSKKRFAKYYEEEYIFRPELGNPKFSCSYQEYIPRQIIVDIPFFQLRLGKIDGTLKVLTFPFHVDD